MVTPIDDEARLAMLADAEAASAAGEWQVAIGRWEALRTQFPEDARSWRETGEAYFQAGLLSTADAILSDAVEKFPNDLWICHRYAFIAQPRSDWREALTRAEKLRDRFPDHAIGRIMLGEAYRALGKLHLADSVFHSAVECFPQDEWAHLRYAELAEYRQDWSQALDRWRAMLKVLPQNKAALIGRDRALRELNHPEEADALIDELRNAVVNEIEKRGIEAALPARLANPQVLIEITSICNFACTYCVSPMKLREKKQMSMDSFRPIIEQVASMTTSPVRLHTDGEPTSHPQFKEMALLVNSYGLPVWLATNGSYLDPSFLDIWMDPLISMSTLPEELAKRHNKLDFDSYIDRIAAYTRAWANSQARQNLVFQIIHYSQADAAAELAYKTRKDGFLVEFCRRAGLYDSCVEATSVEDENYLLNRSGHPGWVQFLKQPVGVGGLYPDDGRMVGRTRAKTGFCDAPWRQLVVHSNNTLGACCVDLSGGTTFATADEVATTPLKQLWESNPTITATRQAFLQGRAALDVCQRCLSQGQVTFPPTAQ
jgi:tetratricopeptide (TPR) repeat protein